MIEIFPLGGYAEVGRNCTAVKVDDDVIILDMGLKMEEYVELTEDEDIVNISARQLINANAVPDINRLWKWKKHIRAIILGHAHLDHIGAIPFLASKFRVPIYGSPYTIAVLKSILKDHRIKIPNKLVSKEAGQKFKVKGMDIEFINMTHSIPDTLLVKLKTKYGDILYANDFKMDMTPVLGAPFSKKKISSSQPKVLIMDSLYAVNETKTPSESVAKKMIQDLFGSTDFAGKALFVTTFASHISRLKTLVEIAKKIKRKPVFLGRSLAKYIEAAKQTGYGRPFKNIEIIKYGSKIRNYLLKTEHPEDYMFIVTGHQGEPKATLSKLADYFPLEPEDVVIFSCTTIPTEITVRNREELERKLKEKHVRMFKDVHVSGHGSREDIRDFIKLVKPKYIISSHAPKKQMEALKTLAEDIGYSNNYIILTENGKQIELE